MGAMQSRPPQPSQASLFDAPPTPETPSEGAAPATDGVEAAPAVEVDPLPSLPLPGFLAESETHAEAVDVDATAGIEVDAESGPASLDIEPAPPADAAEHAEPEAALPPPARPAKA